MFIDFACFFTLSCGIFFPVEFYYIFFHDFFSIILKWFMSIFPCRCISLIFIAKYILFYWYTIISNIILLLISIWVVSIVYY